VLCSKKQAEFEWHVETWVAAIKSDPGEVVDSKATLFDDPENFIESRFARVFCFFCATGNESTSCHRECRSLKERLVLVVEWTVDEDALAKRPALRPRRDPVCELAPNTEFRGEVAAGDRVQLFLDVLPELVEFGTLG
jgi:hypothetical protein